MEAPDSYGADPGKIFAVPKREPMERGWWTLWRWRPWRPKQPTHAEQVARLLAKQTQQETDLRNLNVLVDLALGVPGGTVYNVNERLKLLRADQAQQFERLGKLEESLKNPGALQFRFEEFQKVATADIARLWEGVEKNRVTARDMLTADAKAIVELRERVTNLCVELDQCAQKLSIADARLRRQAAEIAKLRRPAKKRARRKR